jgi:hypothetical protein
MKLRRRISLHIDAAFDILIAKAFVTRASGHFGMSIGRETESKLVDQGSELYGPEVESKPVGRGSGFIEEGSSEPVLTDAEIG